MIPPGPARDAILAQVGDGPGKLSRSKAARMIGCSRQYVGNLVKKPKAAKPAAPAPPARPAAPAPEPARPELVVVPSTGDASPTGSPSDAKPLTLAEILARAGAGAPGAAPPPPGAAPAAPGAPPPPVAPAIDPKDAEAADALLKEGQSFLVESVAVYGFGMSMDDPRLAPLKSPNVFLKISLDRNQDKTAWLGKLTGGIKGLVIGGLLECFRAARHIRGLGVKPVSPASSAGAPAVEEEPAEEEEVVDGGGFDIRKAAEEARGGK